MLWWSGLETNSKVWFRSWAFISSSQAACQFRLQKAWFIVVGMVRSRFGSLDSFVMAVFFCLEAGLVGLFFDRVFIGCILAGSGCAGCCMVGADGFVVWFAVSGWGWICGSKVRFNCGTGSLGWVLGSYGTRGREEDGCGPKTEVFGFGLREYVWMKFLPGSSIDVAELRSTGAVMEWGAEDGSAISGGTCTSGWATTGMVVGGVKSIGELSVVWDEVVGSAKGN